MMVFSVLDSKAQVFNRPFFEKNIVLAARGFESALKDDKSPFKGYESDFHLTQIGTFNEDTGEIIPITPAVVAKGSDFVAKPTVN